MRLSQALRTGVAAAVLAGALVPGQVGAAGGLEVRVGQAEDFSRIEFRGAPAVARREGQTVVVSFRRDGDPDIARLRTDPPRWVKAAEKRHVGGLLQIVLTIADDADVKLGAADGATFVNLFQKPQP